MGGYPDPARRQELEGDAAGCTERRRQTAGEMSPARNVLMAAPFDLGGPVGMARAWDAPELVIVSRTSIGVLNHEGKGCPAGLTRGVEAG